MNTKLLAMVKRLKDNGHKDSSSYNVAVNYMKKEKEKRRRMKLKFKKVKVLK